MPFMGQCACPLGMPTRARMVVRSAQARLIIISIGIIIVVGILARVLRR